MTMHYKIHKLLHPLKCDSREDLLVTELREAILALPGRPHEETLTGVSTAESAWLDFKADLRREIITSDPRYFLHWPIILHTMFYPGNIAEINALKASGQWGFWQKGLEETITGYPIRYKDYPSSSGNLIHHAYLLFRLSNIFNVDLLSLRSIFEFGGGYGSTPRLFYQLGFTGSYTIFDLPEFLLLQKFFLHDLSEKRNIDWGRSVLGKTKFLSSMDTIPDDFSPDLFLAAWSLSESPLDARAALLTHLKMPKYLAIAYQDVFREIDNKAYFKKLTEKMTDYEWVSEPIEHQPGNSFLFGKRKE